MSKFALAVLVAVMMFVLVGCGGGGTSPAMPLHQADWMFLALGAVQPIGDPNTMAIYPMNVGDSRGIGFSVKSVPATGSDVQQWTVEPQGVVRINSLNGVMQGGLKVLYAIAPGVATVKLSWHGGVRAFMVNVSTQRTTALWAGRGDNLQIFLEGVVVDNSVIPVANVHVGDVLHLKAHWTYPGGTLPFNPVPSFDWITGDKSIAGLSSIYADEVDLIISGVGQTPISVMFEGLAITFIVNAT
jgi:hypothetical protein